MVLITTMVIIVVKTMVKQMMMTNFSCLKVSRDVRMRAQLMTAASPEGDDSLGSNNPHIPENYFFRSSKQEMETLL